MLRGPDWTLSLLAGPGNAVGQVLAAPFEVQKSQAIFKNLKQQGTVMTNSHENNSSAWPNDGFVRLNSILAPNGPLPISRSSWWAGVASGRYPKPVKLGPRITAWRKCDLLKLMSEAR
jgi:prophage regulatory protein